MKQETLEEAAEKYANDWEEIHPELSSEDMTPIAISKLDFTEGAKWQQEQDKKLYSEEDVRGMLEDMSRYVSTKEMRDDFVGVGYSEWVRKRDWFVNHLIEQFKKK